MISKDLQGLIARLEITAKKNVSGPLLGDARSKRMGSGFDFHQLRDYIPGDDIRFIDWKASARSDKMLVRQYLEDRNRTFYLVVDLSQSTAYGTTTLDSLSVTKADLIKQIGAILAFVSLQCKDSVGLIIFTDTVEKFIPPRQSRNHIMSLLTTLFEHEPKSRRTDFEAPLEYLSRLKGQKALVCFLSDFIAPLELYERKLAILARRHDVMAFRCLDPRERSFPGVGSLMFEDSELGVKASVAAEKVLISQALSHFHASQKGLLAAARIDCLDIEVGASFAGQLVTFLRHRAFSES
jgi:uncharacterized protein (DUF58 family)